MPPVNRVFTEPSWRIEINRREQSQKEYLYHWIWRLTLADGGRRSRYGGNLDRLPDPQRLTQYKRNSQRYAQRQKEKNA